MNPARKVVLSIIALIVSALCFLIATLLSLDWIVTSGNYPALIAGGLLSLIVALLFRWFP